MLAEDIRHPSVPAPSFLYPASNLDWRFISYMILYMFQCHSPKSSPWVQGPWANREASLLCAIVITAICKASPDSHFAFLHFFSMGAEGARFRIPHWPSPSMARSKPLASLCLSLPISKMGVCAKSLQSCPALCDSMDCSPPGSSVHGDSPGKKTGLGCHDLL